MRCFIILALVGVACAGKLGYNYRPGGGHSGGIGGDHSGGIGGGHFGSGSDNDLAIEPPSIDSGDYGRPGSSFDAPGSGSSSAPHGTGDVKKEFYTFTANDDDFQEPNAAEEASQYLKQGIRVVFIKGPEKNGLEEAALALAKQAAEQHTAIYVLNKQADIGALANKLNAIRDESNNQPEVHFVKYRTPEDAANAQKHIQAEYDNLGGSSQSHNGGVAPVINFASKSPAPSGGGGHRGGIGGGHRGRGGHGGAGGLGGHGGGDFGLGSAPGSTYLPASIIRRFRL